MKRLPRVRVTFAPAVWVTNMWPRRLTLLQMLVRASNALATWDDRR